MSLLVVVNSQTGARRYFLDSRRVSREAYDAASFGRRLDTFQTTIKGPLVRHFCEARS